MREYDVLITETLAMTVTVKAQSAEQARRITEKNWKDGDYIIDADHFKGVTFTSPTRSERER
jgi:hypothetical protein